MVDFKKLERIVLKDVQTKEEYVLYEKGAPTRKEFSIGTNPACEIVIYKRNLGKGQKMDSTQAILTYSDEDKGFKVMAGGRKKITHITRHVPEPDHFDTIGIKKPTLLEDGDSFFLRGYGFFYSEQEEFKDE